jgi:hypothetical protein
MTTGFKITDNNNDNMFTIANIIKPARKRTCYSGAITTPYLIGIRQDYIKLIPIFRQ